MIAQLALGLALAHLRNHGFNKTFPCRTAGDPGIGYRNCSDGDANCAFSFYLWGVCNCLAIDSSCRKSRCDFRIIFRTSLGAVVVWQTRAPTALLLGDDGSSLRSQVARVGLSRIMIHPVFGHGMDAMHKHWQEWGFPGNDMLHFHSTPLQLAFDRGLPMLGFWLWLMIAFSIYISRAEKSTRNSSTLIRMVFCSAFSVH